MNYKNDCLGPDLYGYVLNDPVNKVDPLGLLYNPFANIPSFVERFPNSNVAAPTADIIVGGIEAGDALVSGIGAGISFLAGPEFWWSTAVLTPISLEAGVDSYGRLTEGIRGT